MPVRLNDELDLGPSRAADVANDVVELLLDQVDDFAVFLLDPDDLVFGLKPPVPVGRHVGDDLGHDREAVFRPQRRADPLQREVELLIEHVLEVLGAQVRRVRVERLGQARQIDFHQLAGVDLVGLAVAVAIADRPLAHRFGFIDVVDDLEKSRSNLTFLRNRSLASAWSTG